MKGRAALFGEAKEWTGFKASPGPGNEVLTGRAQGAGGDKTSGLKVSSGAGT